MFHSNIIHKLWVWANAKQSSKISLWCEVQGLPLIHGGLEEQQAPGPDYCLSWVCHSASRCFHMHRRPFNKYLLWQGHGEVELLFIENFIQAEVYS